MFPVIDTPTKRILPGRVGKPVAIVIHNSGEKDLDKCLSFYTAQDGLQPHYFIETTGTIRRIVPENQTAYHCKIDPAEARLYRMGWESWSRWSWKDDQPVNVGVECLDRYGEWKRTWEPRYMRSPLDLVTGEHPNAKSVGVELQNPYSPTKLLYTDEQYEALAFLLADVGERNSIPLRRENVLGHYDCSPMRRSNEKGNWDPGSAFRWMRLWDLLIGANRP